jgi:hypothetical protein
MAGAPLSVPTYSGYCGFSQERFKDNSAPFIPFYPNHPFRLIQADA